MKIVVIGGTGRIGSKASEILRTSGHEVIAAAPSRGIDAVTEEGLAGALAGAAAVIDVANSPSFDPQAVMDFFRVGTTNLIAAARAAGVAHYVALSVVGADRLPENGYLRGKVAQEELIAASGLPFTIVRATQFFEFIGAIAGGDETVRLPSAQLQPILAADVAEAVAAAALAAPTGGIVEVAGPEARPFAGFVTPWLAATGDDRTVESDVTVPYFGSVLEDDSLLPGPNARIMPHRFDAWLVSRDDAR